MNWLDFRKWLLFVVLLTNACGTDDPNKKGNGNVDADAGLDLSDDLSPQTCANTLLDGDETDVDCGGSCGPCGLGNDCALPSDCDIGACTDGICVLPVGSTCTDATECSGERCEAVGDQMVCTTACTDTCPGQNLACFEDRCVPDTYCVDPDQDGLGEGPGCAGTPCDLCDEDATCSQQVDLFVCNCNDGFEGDGNTCTDVDECDAGTDNCADNATCANTVGSFTCECISGFGGDGTTCDDLNECDTGTDNCSANATCTNVIGTFLCDCNLGFTGSGVTCVDVDECANGADNCGANSICTNTDASFECACAAGYAGDGVTCADINECVDGTDNCAANATCNNTPGSFTCGCPAGYSGNGVTCTDINECTTNTDNCSANASCTNAAGSFTCACSTGYTGNGITCTDVNECSTNTDNCSANATCSNTIGGFACACKPGFTGNGLTCTDINECSNANQCSSNGTCTNTLGSFSCACNAGYQGNGATCTDINECVTANTCSTNAVCLNYPGGFSCACGNGYTGDGTTCADLNECALGTDTCDANADCQNVPGFYACSCKTGFTGNGFTCVDNNECTLGTDNCSDNAVCSNTSGSFSCACGAGYQGDGVTCTKIGDTCPVPYVVGALPFSGSGNTTTSTANYGYTGTQCPGTTYSRGLASNDDAWRFTPTTTGNYRIRVNSAFDSVVYVVNDCGSIGTTCLGSKDSGVSSTADTEELDLLLTAGVTYFIIVDGYSSGSNLNGAYTLDVQLNACVNGTDNCTGGATCQVEYPGFSCQCPSGYTQQGNSCVDINECLTNTDDCDVAATCTNTAGGFTCACNLPFVGSGQQCWNGAVLGETCTNPEVIPSVPFSSTGTTSTAFNDLSHGTNQCPGNATAEGGAGADYVYSFTPTVTGNYEFIVTPTSWDNAIYLVTDCASIATTCVGSEETGFTGDAETLSALLTSGTTYFFVVDSFGTSSTGNGAYAIDVTCTDCP
jgi:hypothetical protein